MDWIYHDFYMEYGLIWSELKIENGVTYQDMANSLNWSGFLHGKCFYMGNVFKLFRIVAWQMV